MAGTTYDTGALLAAERYDRRMWALHHRLLAHAVVPVVPAPVLAQAWRGGPRQALLARLLESCTVEDMTEQQARAVGVICGHVDHSDIVDVVVVEGAARRGDGIVTAEADRLRDVARSAGIDLQITAI